MAEKKKKKSIKAVEDIYKKKSVFDKCVAIAQELSGLAPPAISSFNHHTLHTGSFTMDALIGGGWPVRRISSLYGPERSGKTTYVIEAIATALLMDIPIFFMDHEQSLDLKYTAQILRKRGIDDVSFLIGNKKSKYHRLWNFYQPDNGEQTARYFYSILKQMPKEDPKDVVRALFIIDSAATILSEKVVEEDAKEGMAARSRMFGTILPKLRVLSSQRNVVMLITNQIRQNPGTTFGSPEYEPGGNTLQHLTDTRVRVSSSAGKMTSKGFEPITSWLKVKKNKVFVPYIEGQSGISVGTGIDQARDIVEYFKITGQWSNGQISAKHDKRLKKYAGKRINTATIRKKYDTFAEIIQDQFETKQTFELVKENFSIELDDAFADLPKPKKDKKGKKKAEKKSKTKAKKRKPLEL